MVAEVERRNQLQLFTAANLLFADMYHDLVQVVNNNMDTSVNNLANWQDQVMAASGDVYTKNKQNQRIPFVIYTSTKARGSVLQKGN